MTHDEERMQILQQIEEGRITAAEGLRLLSVLQKESAARQESSSAAPAGEAETLKNAPPDPQIRTWPQWWMIPLWSGVVVIVLGSLGMYWALQSSGMGFWFWCSWVPFLIGVGVTTLAWGSRNSRWVHVRVNSGEVSREWPRNIVISLPVPLRVVGWAIRAFGWRIPALKRTALDELLTALEESMTSDAPISIDVVEGEQGERVQVYFG